MIDVVNLPPYFRGEKKEPPHAALYWRFSGQMAIRAGDWKLMKGATGGVAALRREKATVNGAKLFNLKDEWPSRPIWLRSIPRR